MGGSVSAKMGNFPLWRANRNAQNIDSVKADINSGRTYDLNNVIDTPPATPTVIRNNRHAAKTVAMIESRTVLCSSPKIRNRPKVAVKSVAGFTRV
jgi:hypothetical protein